jgi:hypothetical protein
MAALMMQLALGGGEGENFARPFVEDRANLGHDRGAAGRGALLRRRLPRRHHDGLPPSRMFRGQSIDPYSNLKACLARIGLCSTTLSGPQAASLIEPWRLDRSYLGVCLPVLQNVRVKLSDSVDH